MTQHAGRIVVEVDGVHKVYRPGGAETVALAGTDLVVAAGQVVVVSGPSGTGKSTLLHVMGGIDTPDAGTVRVGGEDMARLSADDGARFRLTHIGLVFQDFHLLPSLTAVDNVALPLMFLGKSRSDARRLARALLSELGLRDRAEHRPAEMSGGQMQRVAVARALVTEPDVILADEPTGNLDADSGSTVLSMLWKAATERGAAVVLVTHDPQSVPPGARHVHLRDGRLTEAGI